MNGSSGYCNQRVILLGLTSRTDLNGRHGHAQELGGERYAVMMEDGREIVQVKPANMRVVGGGDGSSDEGGNPDHGGALHGEQGVMQQANASSRARASSSSGAGSYDEDAGDDEEDEEGDANDKEKEKEKEATAASGGMKKQRKLCQVQNCGRRDQGGGCSAHGGGKRCQVVPNCGRPDKGGGCATHGGGRRCHVPNCAKKDLGGGCSTHGGGKRCQVPNCGKHVQSGGGGKCIAHGGGRRCQVPNCGKSARGGGGGKCWKHCMGAARRASTAHS